MNHTKGTWFIQDPSPHGAIGIRLGCGLLIAVVRYSGNPKINRENAKHNARLIAAAPKMYRALKNLETTTGSYLTPRDWHFVDRALRKAEGGKI